MKDIVEEDQPAGDICVDVNIRIIFKCAIFKTNCSAAFLIGYGAFITGTRIDKKKVF